MCFKKNKDSCWFEGKIEKRYEQPRSLVVSSPEGVRHRRNHQNIKKSTELKPLRL